VAIPVPGGSASPQNVQISPEMGMYSRTYFYPVPAKRMSAGSFELLAVAQLTLCAQ
jgi:DsbC/DsbD-like thiol-disulfide interchange protein